MGVWPARPGSLWLLALLLCTVWLIRPAQAVPPALPGGVEPGRDRPLPAPPAALQDYDFRIEAPHRSPVPRDVDTIRFLLSGIRIAGAKTIPAERFKPLYAGLIGKTITLSDIFAVADAIENTYRAAGYPLIRAYVPPQRVSDGIFTINVVEGYVAGISAEGGSADVQDQILAYLAAAKASRPLTLGLLERGLLLANDLPGVKATGILRPAPGVPGASDLAVTIDQPDFSGGFAVDNRGSRFSGIWTLSADAAVNGVIDGVDSLSGAVSLSPSALEQIAGEVRYSHPVGDNGAMGSLLGVITHGQPGSTLSSYHVRTDSFAVGPRLSYPAIRLRAQSLIFDGGLTLQDAKVDILGQGISHDNWRVADLAATYSAADIFGANLGLTLDVAQGLDVLGASKSGSAELSRKGGRTDFTKLSGTLRLTRPLWGRFSAAFVAQGQYSGAPMINGEQITFGGRQIGRGYDPGAITGDDGVGGSVELRYDRRIEDFAPLRLVQAYGFYDTAAASFNTSGAGADPSLHNEMIASVGGGVRVWLVHNITADLEVARTLHAVPGSDSGSKATKVLIDAAVRF